MARLWSMATLLVVVSLALAACGESNTYLDNLDDPRAALKNEVYACQKLHDVSAEGFDIGRFKAGSKALFLTSIQTARVVLDTSGATQVQMETALKSLYAARSLFLSKKYDMYTSLVDKSKNTLDTAVEGSDVYQFQTGSKAAFQIQWDLYSTDVTNETVAIESRVVAWKALREQYTFFLWKQLAPRVKVSYVCANPKGVPVPANTYRFIELYNNSDVDADITSWSLQTTKYKDPLNADGSVKIGLEIKKRDFNTGGTVIVKAKSYLLISNGPVWAAGVTPDFIIEDIDFMMGDGGRGISIVKVNDMLVSNGSPLMVDSVGYSNASPAAGYYEGPTITNTTMIIRKPDSGNPNLLQDTENNRNDFYNMSTETNRWRLPRNSSYVGPCTWP